MKEAKGTTDFPTQPHFAILTFSTETVHESTGYEKEGDYGSKRDISSFKYEWTEDEAEWKRVIDLLYRFSPEKHKFKAIKVGSVATITTKVEVVVD